jgi:hypothetical protein
LCSLCSLSFHTLLHPSPTLLHPFPSIYYYFGSTNDPRKVNSASLVRR